MYVCVLIIRLCWLQSQEGDKSWCSTIQWMGRKGWYAVILILAIFCHIRQFIGINTYDMTLVQYFILMKLSAWLDCWDFLTNFLFYKSWSFCRKVKKPLKPKVTIQVASAGGTDSVPKPIQILASHFCQDQRMLVVHGNYLKPVFEKVVRS